MQKILTEYESDKILSGYIPVAKNKLVILLILVGIFLQSFGALSNVLEFFYSIIQIFARYIFFWNDTIYLLIGT